MMKKFIEKEQIIMKTNKLLTYTDEHTGKTIAYRETDFFVISFRRKTGGERIQENFKASEIADAVRVYKTFKVNTDYMKYFFRYESIDSKNKELIYKERGYADPADYPPERTVKVYRAKRSSGLEKYNLKVNLLPKSVIEAMDVQDWSKIGVPETGPRTRLIQYLLCNFFSLSELEKKTLVGICYKSFTKTIEESVASGEFRLNDTVEIHDDGAENYFE